MHGEHTSTSDLQHALATAKASSSDLEAGSSSSDDVDAQITFRDLEHGDIPELMLLQRDLFPVQYTESFYSKLFSPGYYCLVGHTSIGELVAVASARVLESDRPHDMQLANEAYIMTLGVKVRAPRAGAAGSAAAAAAPRPSAARDPTASRAAARSRDVRARSRALAL